MFKAEIHGRKYDIQIRTSLLNKTASVWWNEWSLIKTEVKILKKKGGLIQ